MSFDLKVTPSTLEVDFDKNLTELYKAITDQNWEAAISVCRKHPVQAATWVVRHYDDDEEEAEGEDKEIMWRFLPIHSACARQPPAGVISALIKAYPDGPRCIDDQGMYALHYACGNQASRDVIRQLLVSCSEASRIPDPRGMLPIHYLACWGPSSVSVMDMILVSHRDVAHARDDEGNTPLELALEGDYPERDAVVSVLRRWLGEDSLLDAATSRSVATSRKSAAAGSKPASVSAHNSRSYSFEAGIHSKKSLEGKPPVSSVAVQEQEEEKKEEEDNSLTSTRYTDVSNRLTEMVLQKDSEMKKLKEELAEKDEALEKKEKELKEKEESENQSVAQEKTWEQQFHELEIKFKEQQDELEAAKKDLESQATGSTKKELEETKAELKESNAERDGLRLTLGDLMEQHESFKNKSTNMNDRLGSLSASLSSIMEQQNILQKSLRERNTVVDKNYQLRKQKLQELIEMEETVKDDEEKLESSMQKQTRELEAIAAVIKAARD